MRPSSSTAEQWTFNPLVQGSNPWGATKRNRITERKNGRPRLGPAPGLYPNPYPKISRATPLGRYATGKLDPHSPEQGCSTHGGDGGRRLTVTSPRRPDSW
jgi:hypothetical protein